jgi:hypothetical protein
MRAAISFVVGLFISVAAVAAQAENNSNHFGPDAHAALGAFRGMVEEHTEEVLRSLRIIADTS